MNTSLRKTRRNKMAPGLVARFDHSEGYKLCLMRASLVVKCHSATA